MWKSIKSLLVVCCLSLFLAATIEVLTAPVIYAQGVSTTSVKGIVKDAMGPVIGASVLVKGGTNGTTTDVDGQFTLSKLKKGDVITISFIGYKTQEIVYNGQTSLQITLVEEAAKLDAVVVTALGIKRQEKALAYNVQQVKSDEITTVKDANFMNSLSGKVAGVTINSSAVGAGGAAKVVMRGVKSISKDNNALYVIDGIPMFNVTTGDTGASHMGNQPGSDAVADLNPEDIESINMLTGPSAAALYGNAAANGVVLINTRRGSKEQTRVTISNNTTFSNVYMMPEMQNRYGNRPGEFGSWGAPVVSDYDPEKFFQTGVNTMNSISFTTGTAKNQTYASVASTNAEGMIPNNRYERYNFTFRNTANFLKDKLTLDLGASFIIQKDKNMTSSGQYYNPVPSLYLFPRGESFDEVRMFERWNEARGIYEQYWPYGNMSLSLQNPFWIAQRMNRENNKKRYMFNTSLKYKITDWMDLTARARVDNTDVEFEKKLNASTDPIFAGYYGNYERTKSTARTFYGDIMLNINKSWDDWSLMVNAGASLNDKRYEMIGYAGDLRGQANFFSVTNLNYGPKFKPRVEDWHDQSQGVFANVEVGWKSMLYLTLTGRNDWESQLAYSKHSSFFYPSVGMSAVVSNMFDAPEWLSFMKVRGSYTEVASSFDRYLTQVFYTFNEENKGYDSDANFPVRDLKPEKTKSWEVGLNMKLWNRINFDMTYYRANTYDQTFTIQLPAASGYKSALIQTGNILNEGIEMALGYSNKWGDFTFSTNYNFTWNHNKVIKVNNGAKNPMTGEDIEMQEFDVASFSPLDAHVILKEGGSMGDVYVTHMLRTDGNGAIYVNPQTNNVEMQLLPERKKIGSVLPDYNMGWSNSFSYKGLDFGFTLTARIGGIVMSGTQGLLNQFGVSEQSAVARDKGGIKINNGMIDAEKYYGAVAGYAAYNAYSATNVRLSEMNVSYTLPKKWFNNKLKMTVGVVAKNLWMIYCKAPFDPEMSASTSSALYSGFDYFMQPSMRNVGFSVKLQF